MLSRGVKPAQLRAQIDRALELKDQGAAAFKAGDYITALKRYHFAVLNLKGIKDQETVNHVTEQVISSHTGITEIESGDEDGEDEEEEVTDADMQQEESSLSQEEIKAKYSFEAVKKALAACFVNMAIIHSKSNAWTKVKRAAESALAVDKDNFKAKFRVAQATIRLGEIGEGRKKLEQLQEEQDDAAIATEFKVLEAAEAARAKKHNDTFRGFLRGGLSGDSSPQKSGDGAAKSTLNPPETPRFTELADEVKSEETTPSTIKEMEPPLTPPKSD